MENQLDTLLGLNDINGRKEHAPQMLSRLHRVPKQIVDTCVSIGGNLKLIESGMPAPVLLPSQIAHDKILSIFDAIADSLIIVCILYMVVFFGINIYSVLPLAIFASYWWFHIAWWQESFAWRGIVSVDEYISKTYAFYNASLLLFLLAFSIAVPYGIQRADAYDRLAKASMSNAAADIKTNIKFNKSKQAENSDLFASLKEKKSPDQNQISNKEDTSFVEASPQNHNSMQQMLIYYSLYMLIFLFLSFMLAKLYKNKYVAFNEKMHEESVRELNSDLKNRQNALRDALE